MVLSEEIPSRQSNCWCSLEAGSDLIPLLLRPSEFSLIRFGARDGKDKCAITNQPKWHENFPFPPYNKVIWCEAEKQRSRSDGRRNLVEVE